jgi:hypothetical protein
VTRWQKNFPLMYVFFTSKVLHSAGGCIAAIVL